MKYRIKRIRFRKNVSRRIRRNRIIAAAAAACFVIAVISAAAVISGRAAKNTLAPIPGLPEVQTHTASDTAAEDIINEPSDGVYAEAEDEGEEPFMPYITDNTVIMDTQGVTAKNALLADASTGEVLGIDMGLVRIYPASMTKVMTLLVVSEHLDSSQLDDTYTMTYELLQPLVEEHASRVGFMEAETVTVRDMVYGLILPSGADAAVGLCNYIAGSEEKFTELMNEKAKELGLKYTHFVNSSGLHDEQHYTTCAEMAAIMKAAMDDPFCREILSTYTYTTSQTEQHPEGIEIFSDAFSRMYGTEVEGVVITSGKTGYTDEAGQCLVSYAEKDGHGYILVLAGDTGRYGPIYSSFYAYGNYLP